MGEISRRHLLQLACLAPCAPLLADSAEGKVEIRPTRSDGDACPTRMPPMVYRSFAEYVLMGGYNFASLTHLMAQPVGRGCYVNLLKHTRLADVTDRIMEPRRFQVKYEPDTMRLMGIQNVVFVPRDRCELNGLVIYTPDDRLVMYYPMMGFVGSQDMLTIVWPHDGLIRFYEWNKAWVI